MGLCTVKFALQFSGLGMAEWLVDEAVCELPAPAAGPDVSAWRDLLEAAVRSSDGLAKLRWVQERGGPALSRDSGRELGGSLLIEATFAGQVEVVRYLVALVGLDAPHPEERADAAVQSGSIPVAEWLHQAGVLLSDVAYREAAPTGNLELVRWLACVAGVSARGMLVDNFERTVAGMPYKTPADSRDLMEAVQLVVGAGFCNWTLECATYWCGVEIAAARGNFELVQYLLQRLPVYRYPLTGSVMAAAAEGGCEALLEWLVEQHPKCIAGTGVRESPYATAAANADLGTLTALRRLGVPWGVEDVVSLAARKGAELPALRWLVGQGAPVGSAEEGSREQVQEARRRAELRVNDGVETSLIPKPWMVWMWRIGWTAWVQRLRPQASRCEAGPGRPSNLWWCQIMPVPGSAYCFAL